MKLNTEQTILLDFTVPNIKNVRCVENDKNSRILNITVTNNGKAYPLNNKTMTARYKIRKPDGTYIYNTVPIHDDGTVTIELTEQALAATGIAHSELQISDSETGNILSTMPFHIIVEKSVISNQDIVSGNESDVINSMINHLENYNNPHKIPISTDTADGLLSKEDHAKYEAAYAHSQSTHAPANAQANQNAFSHIAVGNTIVSADTPTDTFAISAGTNITLTPDATNDKLTISSKDTVYAHPTKAGYRHIPAGGSSGQILKWSADGTAVWGNEQHVSVTKSTDSTSNISPNSGGTFTAVDSVTRDSYGHVTNVNTKTITLPDTNIAIDSALSSTSTNPVQNMAVKAALDKCANKATIGYSDVNNLVNEGMYQAYRCNHMPDDLEFCGVIVAKAGISLNDTRIRQIAFGNDSYTMYVRYTNDSTDSHAWSEWKKMLTVEDISQNTTIATQGTYVLDAIEKNSSVSGTLAYQIAELKNNEIFKRFTKYVTISSDEVRVIDDRILVNGLEFDGNRGFYYVNMYVLPNSNIRSIEFKIPYRDFISGDSMPITGYAQAAASDRPAILLSGTMIGGQYYYLDLIANENLSAGTSYFIALQMMTF